MSAIPGGILKVTIYELNQNIRQIGREVNAEEIADIVMGHATATAISAAASGALPGAGSVIAMGIAVTSTVSMYGRLAKAMGVKLSNGLIRAVASAVVADVGASVAASLVAAAAISFIPGMGTLAASTLTAIANFGCVYLAGIIFVKMAAALGLRRMENMTETEMKEQVRRACSGINMRQAMKEAREAYKATR